MVLVLAVAGARGRRLAADMLALREKKERWADESELARACA